MPLAPWQGTQVRAFARPACASAASAAGAQATNSTTAARPRISRSSGAVVGDAVDRAGEIVGHQKRAVLHLRNVDGTSAIHARLLVEKARCEGFHPAGGAVGL